MAQQNKKNYVRLGGMMFMLSCDHSGVKKYLQLPLKKPVAIINHDDPLAKTKEYMRQHGMLHQFLQSLKPENRECAGCM